MTSRHLRPEKAVPANTAATHKVAAHEKQLALLGLLLVDQRLSYGDDSLCTAGGFAPNNHMPYSAGIKKLALQSAAVSRALLLGVIVPARRRIPGASRAYHAMIKPIGAIRNLECTHRYYLHKEGLLGCPSMYLIWDSRTASKT